MNKVVLLFPGQGTQYVGMGKVFSEQFPIAARTFEEANDILGFNLKDLCFNGDLNELSQTENTQPAILAVTVAMYRVLWQEVDLEPDYLTGHSLGEISALTCAEGISFPDALKIVRERGRAMQNAVLAGNGAMLAVNGIEAALVEAECNKERMNGKPVAISNYNSPLQQVISGSTGAVQKVGAILEKAGANLIPLQVSAPFHSVLMESAARAFQAELGKYTFRKLKWPVISNVNARPYKSQADIVPTLVQQMVKPVQWRQTVEFLQEQGVRTAIEIGPKAILKNLMKYNAHDILTLAYDLGEDRDVVQRKFSRVYQTKRSNSENLLNVINRCLAIAVCTRNQNWNNEEYQRYVIEPYRKIQALQLDLKSGKQEIAVEDALQALEMLRLVFKTKRTPVSEQVDRFEQIFSETNTRTIFADFEITI
jgi:[acyl-carrier-protein] S-malonyltransferase